MPFLHRIASLIGRWTRLFACPDCRAERRRTGDPSAVCEATRHLREW